MIDYAVGRALLQLGRVLHKVIIEVQKSVAKKFLWQHSYTIKMLYFECAKYHSSDRSISTRACGTRPNTSDRLVIFCSIQSITSIYIYYSTYYMSQSVIW